MCVLRPAVKCAFLSVSECDLHRTALRMTRLLSGEILIFGCEHVGS